MKKKIFFIIVISYILLPHATFATSGWISSDNNIYYYENEVAQTGHQTIDGYKYYFDEEGKMHKGFLPVDGKVYYYGMGTGQLKYGWSYVGNDTYYSNESGELVTGHQTISGHNYYFESDGRMYKGFLPVDGKVYYYGMGTGQLKYGWSYIGNKIYYSNQEGIIQTGYQTIDGNDYIFNENGELQTGWQTINGKTYYFYADGTKARYFAKIAGIRYEFSTTGELQHSNVKIIADLSFHNGWIDWDTLWNSGQIDGVILRIGYSLGMDRMFQTYLAEARRLGIPYSVYHFSIAENYDEAQNEANKLVEWYKGNSLDTAYGVFYDIEGWYNHEDGQSSDGISIGTYDTIISTYKNTLNNNGIYMSLYTGKNYAETRLSDYGRDQINWIAHYATDCGYRGNYRGWQYTSKGSLPGVSGNVDLSVFYY